MVFPVQFGMNKHLQIFQRPQILLVFEKFTRAYLFQVAHEIMWLPKKVTKKVTKKSKMI